MIKKFVKNITFAILIAFTATTAAKDEVYTSFFSSKAVSGYDVVSYFTQGKPVEGSSEFSTEYKDATWLFSSQEHLDAFIKNPEKYAPQYGGYCAYAVAKGTTASADPNQWSIIDGKLYLNYNADVQADWSKDPEKYIQQANSNWPKVIQ